MGSNNGRQVDQSNASFLTKNAVFIHKNTTRRKVYIVNSSTFDPTLESRFGVDREPMEILSSCRVIHIRVV